MGTVVGEERQYIGGAVVVAAALLDKRQRGPIGGWISPPMPNGPLSHAKKGGDLLSGEQWRVWAEIKKGMEVHIAIIRWGAGGIYALIVDTQAKGLSAGGGSKYNRVSIDRRIWNGNT